MDASDGINLALGVLELALAAVALTYLVRFGLTYPWLAALAAFFGLRGIDRIYAGATGGDSLGMALDIALIGIVVTLIVGLEKTATGLKSTERAAVARSGEYERALADYQRLARHRLANPITAVRGSIQTLKEMPDLDPEERQQLLEAADEQAQRLEQIALDPEPEHPEERGLEPRPRL